MLLLTGGFEFKMARVVEGLVLSRKRHQLEEEVWISHQVLLYRQGVALLVIVSEADMFQDFDLGLILISLETVSRRC